MLYPGISNPYRHSAAPAPKSAAEQQSEDATFYSRSHLLAHLIHNADSLPVANVSLALLSAGQTILHHVARPLGHETSMAISTLFRWTHPSIYGSADTWSASGSDVNTLIVPGGLVLSSVIACTSRSMFETLCEALVSCSLLHTCSPNDVIGAVSYIASIKSLKQGSIEELDVYTLGLKVSLRHCAESMRVRVLVCVHARVPSTMRTSS